MTEHDSLASALVAALADLTVIEKGRTVDYKTKTGERVNYTFSDIADVVKLTRPRLAEHGIVALTPVHEHGSGLACTVTLLHASGDRLDLGPFPFPHGRDAQATGSMVTYHRRYALVAALGMAAGDDDDGAAAQPRPPEPAWTVAAAKQRLVAAVGKDHAPQAWIDLHGDDQWQAWEHAFPTADVEAWVNQPAEETTGE